MGKRFLISLALIIVIIGAIALGSSVIFSGQYETLAEQQAEQSAAATQNISDLAAAAGAALEQQPDGSSADESALDSSNESAPSSTAPENDTMQAGSQCCQGKNHGAGYVSGGQDLSNALCYARSPDRL